MDSKNKSIFTTPLPTSGLASVDDASIEEITEFVRDKLPQTDKKDTEEGLNWHLILEKRRGRTKKQPAKRKTLTCQQRRALGLTKLPRAGWEHRKLLKMNEMWREYAAAALNHPKRLPMPDEPSYANFCAMLNKLELVGAEIGVVRSNVPSYVGASGIVVMETKFTIQIVTRESKFKILLKENCVFRMHLGNWRFTMFGKHFITRSSERSVRRIKYYSISDL